MQCDIMYKSLRGSHVVTHVSAWVQKEKVLNTKMLELQQRKVKITFIGCSGPNSSVFYL